MAGNISTTSGIVTSFPIVGGLAVQGAADETSAQIKIYTAGTIDKLFVSILNNSVLQPQL